MRPDIYDGMYDYAKEYIKGNSIYLPQVVKNAPTESNIFPLVVIPECKIILDDETLKYGEQKYKVIFDIGIYATDQTVGTKKVSKGTIISELKKLVYEVFEEHFRMLGGEPRPMPNADINISRLGIVFTGKYKNNIFYRR